MWSNLCVLSGDDLALQGISIAYREVLLISKIVDIKSLLVHDKGAS